MLSSILASVSRSAIACLRRWRGCAAGTAVLLVEQVVEKALAASDRIYALAQERTVLEARASEPDTSTGWSRLISASMPAPHSRSLMNRSNQAS
jgi:ABC-type branched-subunit amino acid transport system ATPase component